MRSNYIELTEFIIFCISDLKSAEFWAELAVKYPEINRTPRWVEDMKNYVVFRKRSGQDYSNISIVGIEVYTDSILKSELTEQALSMGSIQHISDELLKKISKKPEKKELNANDTIKLLGKFVNGEIKKKRKKKKKKKQYERSNVELADDFMDYFTNIYTTWYEGKRKRFWIYNSEVGLWENIGERVFQLEALKWKKRQIEFRKSDTSFLSHVKARLVFIEHDKTLPEPENRNKIPLLNGVYDIEVGDMLPHDAKYYFTARLNIKHVGYASDITQNFLYKLCGDWVDDPHVLINLMSYIMMRYQPREQFFILAGGGENGKSTFLEVVKKIVGEDNYCSVSPDKIQRERFAKKSLFGKYVNLSPEISPKTWTKTEHIKSLTGNEMVEADVKNKEPIRFQNYANLVMSANRLPSTIDHSHGFYRRLNVINFKTIMEKKKIHGLDERIRKLGQEADEFGSYCLENIEQLRANNWKVLQKSQNKRIYSFASSPYKFFVDEFTTEIRNDYYHNELQKKRELYEAYELLVENSSRYLEPLNQREQRNLLSRWGVKSEERGGGYDRGFLNCFLINTKINKIFRQNDAVDYILNEILNCEKSGKQAINKYLRDTKQEELIEDEENNDEPAPAELFEDGR